MTYAVGEKGLYGVRRGPPRSSLYNLGDYYPECIWKTVYPRWTQTWHRGYLHLEDGWETASETSDVCHCSWCGYRNPAEMGEGITQNARKHREACRGGENVWVSVCVN